MSIIIDGKATAKMLNDNLKNSIKELTTKGNRAPKLVVLQVGDNPASNLYIRNKKRACENVGIIFEHFVFPNQITEEEILGEIKKINDNNDVDGLIIQLPLPQHINEDKVIYAIDPAKDADGFSPITLGKVLLNTSHIFPGTPKGILKLLQMYNIPIEGANVVVIGRSNIVGKPIANMLTNLSATVTVCHSKTKDLAKITSTADILIVAIGKAKFVTSEFIKKGAVIIDVGINKVDGIFFGDVDFADVENIASAITPVPGGVGPMTVASLLDNVFTLYKEKIGK